MRLSLAAVLSAWVALSAAGWRQPAPVEWLIFVDDLHLRFIETGRLRQVVRAINGELVRAGDRCVIRCSGPSCQPGGSNAPAGCEAFASWRGATGNGLREDDLLRAASGAPGRRELEYRARTALAAAEDLLAGASAPAGHTSLLYVSNGYLTLAGAEGRLAALADAAAARSVRVWPIDIRSAELDPTRYPALTREQWRALITETAGSLAVLADRTAGSIVTDPLEGGLARIRSSIR